MTHALKTIQPYFDDVNSWRKNFEVRKNDRQFKVGDKLLLQEYVGGAVNKYTGKEIERVITYILEGGHYGIHPDYCVIGMKEFDY